ncbi:sugar transferase [Porphyromonas sp. COT-239 OH1446]|uniref:sugar transferase n=1 Tax=Porphyromonas sp. COT-239 OH1446 TaxID=1515613 RepID=UPI0009DFE743|nr:sugar transferase [Porphyromonas sp. COT-239 OH1446]
MQAYIKRLLDIVMATISMIVFSPVMLIIAIAIKREDPHGDIIYSQERIGYRGKPFTLYKFRSMRMDAELDNAPQLYLGEDEDPRLTKIGRFIRAHHLDEFPQLWNVLRGDMSFVGYRPERKFFIDQIIQQNPDYVRLYAMRPGLFSYATLYNGYTDTIEKMLERLRLDLEYLEKQSIFFDIKIIVLTAFSIIFGKKF